MAASPRAGRELAPGEALTLMFADRTPVAAHVDGGALAPSRTSRRSSATASQGDLF